MTKLRLAIVGAGPAGIYAADILLKAERKFDVSIDLFEQLPAPYGLVRYGVAPDHPRIKGIITALREVLDRGDIRLFGNVRFGEDITLEDLKHHYNAVIFATGAIRDADLDIPGIDADRLVRRRRLRELVRRAPRRAARVAAGRGIRRRDRQRQRRARRRRACSPSTPRTCCRPRSPTTSTTGLAASAVTDVHVFGRRGPAQVKFTPLELRELGELRDVDMVVYDEDFDYDEASQGRDREQQAGHGDRPRAAVVAQAPFGEQRRGSRHPVACTCTSTPSRSRSSRTTTAASRRSGGSARARTARAASSAPARSARCRSRRSTARSATSARRCPGVPVRQAPRRHPQPRGSGAAQGLERPGARRVRDRAGSSADRSGSSATPSPTRWRRSATSSTTRGRGGSPRTRRRRRSRRCSPSAACGGPTSTAGTASTSTRSALGAPARPRAHQGRAARRDGASLARRVAPAARLGGRRRVRAIGSCRFDSLTV